MASKRDPPGNGFESPAFLSTLSEQVRKDVRDELHKFLKDFNMNLGDAFSRVPSPGVMTWEEEANTDLTPDKWNDDEDELGDELDLMEKHNMLCHRVADVLRGHEEDSVPLRHEGARAMKMHETSEEWQLGDKRPFVPRARPVGLINASDHLLDEEQHNEDNPFAIDLLAEEQRYSNSNYSVVQRIVLSLAFQQLIAFIICLNACSIGLETDYQAKHVGKSLPSTYTILDKLFFLCFAAEFIAKSCVLGCSKYFCGTEAGWQVFDFSVLSLQLISYVLETPVFQQNNRSARVNLMLFRTIRLFRAARILRVIRVIKVFKFIGELHTIVAAIASSLESLVWAVFVVTIMTFVAAIFFTHLVTTTREGHSREEVGTAIEELDMFYGTLWRSSLTIFECSADGMHWGEMMSLLTEHVSPLAGGLFLFYITFSLFAVANVVTGIFVTKAMEFAQEQDDDRLMGILRESFLRTDEDGSGCIAWEEFDRCLQTAEMKKYFRIIDVDMSEAKVIFNLIDADGSGSVDPHEFVSACLRLRGPAKAVELSLLMRESKRMNQWLRQHIRTLESRITWTGNLLHRMSAPRKRSFRMSAMSPRNGT